VFQSPAIIRWISAEAGDDNCRVVMYLESLVKNSSFWLWRPGAYTARRLILIRRPLGVGILMMPCTTNVHQILPLLQLRTHMQVRCVLQCRRPIHEYSYSDVMYYVKHLCTRKNRRCIHLCAVPAESYKCQQNDELQLILRCECCVYGEKQAEQRVLQQGPRQFQCKMFK
jgi:hypothetical protein